MSYPAFGKVKTIVLPCLLEGGSYDESGVSLDTYKLLFGIDLRDYIYFDANEIKINANNTQFLLQPDPAKNGGGPVPSINSIMSPNKYEFMRKNGNTEAVLSLYFTDNTTVNYFGIRIIAPDSNIETARVYPIVF